MRYLLGEKLSLVPLLLVLLALWDISYRLGVGLWSAVISFKRSTGLRRVSRIREKMRYVDYHEMPTLKRVDFTNLVMLFCHTSLVPFIFYRSGSIWGALDLFKRNISILSCLSYNGLSSCGQIMKKENEMIGSNTCQDVNVTGVGWISVG